MAHINVSDLRRLEEIVSVLIRHGFGELMSNAGLERFVPKKARIQEGEGSGAARLKRAMIELGTTAIKLGQMLSVRPDIMPSSVVAEFQSLQDNVPPVPFEQVREVLLEELGSDWEQTLIQIDPAPLASASIAQVHLATLKDGQEVAVKVQRPGIAKKVRSDLHILYTLAQLIEGQIELPGVYRPVEIVEEFESALLAELDFRAEADNAQRLRDRLARTHPDVVIPDVHRELSTERVLILDRIGGGPSSQVKPTDPHGPAFARTIIECFVAQVFEHGLFHGDPHPGNLRILEDGRLALLDFGVIGALTEDMRKTAATTFMALVLKDAESLALTIYRSGANRGRVNLRTLRTDVARAMDKYHGASLSDLGEKASLTEFIDIASRHGIRLPREFALLARTTALVEGLVQKLLPDTDIAVELEPQARILIERYFTPNAVMPRVSRMLLQTQSSLNDLPLQLNQILLDLENGQLEVVQRDPDAAVLRREVRHAGTKIATAICLTGFAITGAAFVASAVFLEANASTTRGHWLLICGIGSLAMSGLCGLGLFAQTLFSAPDGQRSAGSQFAAFARFFRGQR